MSSKRAQRWRSCTGKVRHPDAAAAARARGALHARKGYQGPMNVYRCSF